MKSLVAAISAAVVAFAAAPALGQSTDYPNRPIRLVLTTPPGGAVDVLGRLMASELTKTLGQPVVVENRGGANGNLAGEAVARSTPDGYTLLQTSGGMLSTNPHLYTTMTFDPLKDLVPITQVALNPLWLVVNSSMPVKALPEFIAHLKANPNKASYGSAGNGSALHIAQEAFARATGATALHVPYKGAGPALQDVMGGQVDFVWDPGLALRQVAGGKIKILAVGAPKRLSAAPDVPTVAEFGYAGFNTASAHALLAPAGTPKAIVARLNRDAVQALRRPEIAGRIRSMGIEPIGNSPEEAAADIRSEHARLGELVRHAKIKLD